MTKSLVPLKLAKLIKLSKTINTCKHNQVAYILNSLNHNEKEISKEKVLVVVNSVYVGYTVKR